MSKRIRHMGLTITKEEHERWHKEHPELSAKQHEALIKRLGVSAKEDAEWHRTHQTMEEQRAKGVKAADPAAISGAFLAWCTKQRWLVQQGKQYFATKEGKRELHERFGIAV